MQLESASKLPGSSENTVKADINVTPLVDVCLVMLIIFMVVTPMMIKGADVNLPQTTKPLKMPEGGKQITVAMTARGDVVVQGVWVPEDSLKSFFKDLHEQKPDGDVVIKGDKELRYKQVRRLMKVLNEAGFGGVGLVAERKQTDFQKIASGIYEVEYEVRLRNHKDTRVTVEVNEPLGGTWQMLRSSYGWEKTDAWAAQFTVPVAASGESILQYRVRVRY